MRIHSIGNTASFYVYTTSSMRPLRESIDHTPAYGVVTLHLGSALHKAESCDSRNLERTSLRLLIALSLPLQATYCGTMVQSEWKIILRVNLRRMLVREWKLLYAPPHYCSGIYGCFKTSIIRF